MAFSLTMWNEVKTLVQGNLSFAFNNVTLKGLGYTGLYFSYPGEINWKNLYNSDFGSSFLTRIKFASSIFYRI